MVDQIYLLRHGETEWTISGRHTGVTEVALTARGEQEARSLGERLRGVAFQHIFTSPRLRARKTCALADLGERFHVNEDLREWDYGQYEGLLTREILAQRPTWKIFEDGCPGGESADQVGARADRVLAALKELDGTIALFSHGHFTRVLAARWVGLPVAQGQVLASSTGSVGILGFSPNGPRPVLQLWNSVRP